MPIPDFVLQMRQKIGNDLMWMIGVSVVVQDASGQVLMARRADNGLWALPSGIVEPGEHPCDTAVREVAEELGVEIEIIGLAAVSVTPVITYYNGNQAQYLDHLFAAYPVGGQARICDDENTEVAWVSPQQLPAPRQKVTEQRLSDTEELFENGPIPAKFRYYQK